MNHLDEQYQNLLKTILEHGVEKEDRTGTGTHSIFGYTIRHNMKEGFPILTTKKMAWKQIVTELLWFLRGDTNIKFLHENNCHIWDGDYEKSGRTDGELGPIYGKQWRNWGGYYSDGHWNPDTNEVGRYFRGIDQVQNVIDELKKNPDSRRLLVNAWNVGELDQMTLPPCHTGFQCYTRELDLGERISIFRDTFSALAMVDMLSHRKLDALRIPKRGISLMWTQRSVDTFLGLPFNIASYGLLLEILAKEVNMIPDQLIGNLGDTHIYKNHIDQVKEQLTRDSYVLPRLITNTWDTMDTLEVKDLKLSKYNTHKTIKAPLST